MRQTDYESIGILSRAFISLKFRADQTGVESHFAQGFKNSIILMTIRSRRAETETHKRRVAFGWLLLESGVLYICISISIHLYTHPSLFLYGIISYPMIYLSMSISDKRPSRWMDWTIVLPVSLYICCMMYLNIIPLTYLNYIII